MHGAFDAAVRTDENDGRILQECGVDRGEKVTLAVGSCAAQFGPVFDRIAERKPDVFVWQGDLNYPDTMGPLAQTVPAYAGIWREFLANPRLAPILDRTAFAVQRDDHDYGLQDANSTNLVEHGLTPWTNLMERRTRYRFRAGLAEVWVLDQRLHKTDPAQPDGTEKTLLGANQGSNTLNVFQGGGGDDFINGGGGFDQADYSDDFTITGIDVRMSWESDPSTGRVFGDPGIGTDTIAAIATPPGRGGLGIVRVSGPGARAICSALIGRVPEARVATLARFRGAGDMPIDSGLALFFPSPHSFTGEDVLELQGHGGTVVLDLLLERCLALGARIARPGEFSERDIAFLQGAANILGMAIERQRYEQRLHDALEHQKVLLNEINHRVKNSLQMVASLFRLQAATSDDPRVTQSLHAAMGRITAVARIHERLYRSPDVAGVDLAGYLGDICADLAAESWGLTGIPRHE